MHAVDGEDDARTWRQVLSAGSGKTGSARWLGAEGDGVGRKAMPGTDARVRSSGTKIRQAGLLAYGSVALPDRLPARILAVALMARKPGRLQRRPRNGFAPFSQCPLPTRERTTCRKNARSGCRQ